jgi:hypothetical protein
MGESEKEELGTGSRTDGRRIFNAEALSRGE